MRTFKRICGVLVATSAILDILLYTGVLFSAGLGAHSSKVPSFSDDALVIFGILFVPFVLIITWVYISSNKEKYPRADIVMSGIVTLMFIFPWLWFLLGNIGLL
jgi:hypothetical protein